MPANTQISLDDWELNRWNAVSSLLTYLGYVDQWKYFEYGGYYSFYLDEIAGHVKVYNNCFITIYPKHYKARDVSSAEAKKYISKNMMRIHFQ